MNWYTAHVLFHILHFVNTFIKLWLLLNNIYSDSRKFMKIKIHNWSISKNKTRVIITNFMDKIYIYIIFKYLG